jgi:hypothetical protein
MSVPNKGCPEMSVPKLVIGDFKMPEEILFGYHKKRGLPRGWLDSRYLKQGV